MRKIIALILAVILMTAGFNVGISAADTNVKQTVKVEANKLELNEKDCSIKIIYPVFSGFNSAAKLNDMIQNKNADSIGFIKNALNSLEEIKEEQKKAGQQAPNLEVSLDSSFDYNKSGNILSVMMNSYNYTGGAHGFSVLDAVTVNTQTDETYTFNSLFNQKSSYKKVILDKINAMIDKEKDLYFEDAKQSVVKKNSDYQFYIDGNKLVIYFGLYELRPYAGGMSEFAIYAKDLKGLLKDEVYSQMINAKPLEKVLLNGTSMNPQLKTYEHNYTLMVPLKNIAELLGYKVTWDSKKGAGVAGGFIKNGQNNYSANNKAPVKLAEPAKIVGNQTYVPIEYFSEVLNEDVSYYGENVRIFKIAPAGNENQFNKQILEFTMPNSAEECAEMYAKAVKERKGAIQYALFSEKLRAANKSAFEDLNWVTGVSSPWVTGYDINKTGSDTFNVIFHWATSAGKTPDTKTIIKTEKIPEQEFWQITDITGAMLN